MSTADIFADKAAYEAVCKRIFHTDGAAQLNRFKGLIDAHKACF